MDPLRRRIDHVVKLVDLALCEPTSGNIAAAKKGAADLLPRLRRLLETGTASATTVADVAQLNALLLALRRRLDGTQGAAPN
jgi:hypothetical protein